MSALRQPEWLLFEGAFYRLTDDYPEGPPWTHVDRANRPVPAVGKVLTDLDLLRTALRYLDNAQLGAVLGMVLAQINDRGESSLANLLEQLAGQVREIES